MNTTTKITNQQDWEIQLKLCPMNGNVCYHYDGAYEAIDFTKEYVKITTKGNKITLERIQYNLITRLWKQLKLHVVTLVSK
jgi:hypothetical protein